MFTAIAFSIQDPNGRYYARAEKVPRGDDILAYVHVPEHCKLCHVYAFRTFKEAKQVAADSNNAFVRAFNHSYSEYEIF